LRLLREYAVGIYGEVLMATDGEGVALLEGEEKSVSLGGATIVFKATGKETGGAYALLEYTADPGAGDASPATRARCIR
jgi:hypothetical protein